MSIPTMKFNKLTIISMQNFYRSVNIIKKEESLDRSLKKMYCHKKIIIDIIKKNN